MNTRWFLLCVTLLVSLTHTSQASAAAGLDRRPDRPRWRSPVFMVREIPPPPNFDFLVPKRINRRGDVLGHGDASTGIYADAAHAALYENGRTTDLHLLLPPGVSHSSTLAVDLNDRGQALFADPGGPETFLYASGRVVDFETLTHEPQLQVLGLNARGQFVGSRGPFDGDGEAFLYHHRQLQLLEALPGTLASGAFRISNSGYILGSVTVAGPAGRTVIFGPDTTIDLGTVQGLDINDAGHVVTGFNTTADAQPGWLWVDGTWTELPFNPAALNDLDEIVGRVGPWPHRAVWYFGGEAADLNELIDPNSGWTLYMAEDINNRGQIVGVGRFNGNWAGFLLTPVHRIAPPSRRSPKPNALDRGNGSGL